MQEQARKLSTKVVASDTEVVSQDQLQVHKLHHHHSTRVAVSAMVEVTEEVTDSSKDMEDTADTVDSSKDMEDMEDIKEDSEVTFSLKLVRERDEVYCKFQKN